MDIRKSPVETLEVNNFWQDKRVFITGASGLVGSWLVEELLNRNANVVILLRDWIPGCKLIYSKLLKKTNIVRGDLSDVKLLERVLNEYEIESVIHLAAQTIVPIANRNPLSTFESNITGTYNLLEACRSSKNISSVVVASSDKAYGEVVELPYKEIMPLKALYPYDVSKACADMLSICYATSFNLPVAVTRCGNFFGGGDLNWNRIIPGTIRSVIRNEIPIIRSDGKLIRDYIYVEDAVSAYMTLSQALTLDPSLRGEAFNFSNETQKTVYDLTLCIIKLLDSNVKPIIQGKNINEIKAQYLDSSKAKKILSWYPEFGFEEGLKKTIEWYKKYLGSN